ncbi:hypothetical protein [uncultured Ruthenibacterium sp.]|uniref:hypothetical protein n=1 Tax=uncultured Ruthenibacterium sp. TaxID=1905347 RepID=UPI00349EB193
MERISGRRPAFDVYAEARALLVCPACGAPVYTGDRYFMDGVGRPIACEHCPSVLA